ncbi:hypothetical protein CLOP_g10275 [Closterium sp. NIES-67]|nr:hypothetical protein CLOP_g10275 [Closterium sp. NIES-67]
MGDFDEYDYLEKTVERAAAGEDGYATGRVMNGGRSRRPTEFDDDARQRRRTGSKRRSTNYGDGDGYDDDENDGGGPYGDEENGDVGDEELDDRSKRVRRYEEPRSHSRDGERSHRSWERGRERDGDRDVDRKRDRYYRSRDDERERDYYRGDHYSSRGRDRGDRDLRRDYYEGDRRRDRDPDYYDRRSFRERRERREKEAEIEPDPDRDLRTVFAYQINLKADERDVYEFFSQAGKVRDVRLITDRHSRRSKGVGYVEFYDPMAVPMALALSGQLILGTPVMVKPSEAEKNLAAAQSAASAAAAGGGALLATGSKRLHVGNLHVNMNEEQLRQVFEPFGELELVQVPMDPGAAQCHGFGFVQYARLEDARMAHQNLEGLELAGLAIKITPVPELAEQVNPVAPGELTDEGGGLGLDAQARAALMMKLDRTGTSAAAVSSVLPAAAAAAAAGPGAGVRAVNPLAAMALRPGVLPTTTAVPAAAATAAAPAVDIGTPSEFVLLTNMFDSSEQIDDEFEQDVQDDVFEECSKFGTVKKVKVHR